MNGIPSTGAIHFGKSATALRKRVPKPPANIIAVLIIPPSPKGELFYEPAFYANSVL
jgi:hypothetical protein